MKWINCNILFLIFTFICICVGCTQDGNGIYEGNKNDGKGVNLQLSITRAVANTNGLAKIEEMDVSSAYVYIFNADGELENVGQTKVINTPVLQNVNSTTDQINRLWHVKEGVKSIYVILNPQDLSKNLDTWEPISVNDIKALVTTDNRSDGIKLFNGKVEGKTKLMTGCKENFMVTGNGGSGSVVIPIERRYAALELDLRKSELIESDVTVTKVTISNLTWQSKVFDSAPWWTGGATDENGGEIISYENMNMIIPADYTSIPFAGIEGIIAPERFYMSPRSLSVSRNEIPRIDIVANVNEKEITYKAYLTELTNDGKCDLSKPLAVEANTIYKIQATLMPKYEDLHINIITQPWDAVAPQDSTLHPGEFGMTNCYMVNPGRSVSIPVMNVYKIWNWEFEQKPSISPEKEVKAEIIWEDTQGLITDVMVLKNDIDNSYSKIQVKTSSGKSGNAVIGMWIDGDRAKTYRWSWHVWVTDYNPSNNNSIYSKGGVTFMDRNLGALSNQYDVEGSVQGLNYQWGRKDPFPTVKNWFDNDTHYPQNTIQLKQVVDKVNLINGIQYPYIFYFNQTDRRGDWYTITDGEQNDKLWQNNIKTIYDPCPDGWRIPSSEVTIWNGRFPFSPEWEYLNNEGITSPDIGFYPFAAIRSYSTGITSYGNNASGFWCTGNFIFNNSWGSCLLYSLDLPSNVSGKQRAFGYSVRCVKE